MKEFNVLRWDFNQDGIEYYDVLPYFRREYKRRVQDSKKKRVQKSIDNDPTMIRLYRVPTNREEMKEFIKTESAYQFWGRCEYEMICHGWPTRKSEHKLDVHEQIMMNIDIVADILCEELCNKGVKK